jgi:hypothetical protein
VPIPLHAACGLLGNYRIYIFGGKTKDANTEKEKWLTTHYRYDFIEGVYDKI